jgi:predicted acetyltransferase
MRLMEPVIERAEEYFALCNELSAENGSFYRNIRTIDDTRAKIRKDMETALGIIQDSKIKLYTYWAMSDGDEIVGTSVVCTNPDIKLLKYNGHIGYSVRQSYRRQGYGTEILRLTLIEAYKKGLIEVRACCDSDNIGSSKIIEKNKGRVEDTIIHEESNKEIKRYLVSTSRGYEK